MLQKLWDSFAGVLLRLEEDVSFQVQDLDSAAAWYQEKLGCKIRPMTDEDEGDWDEVDAGVVCNFDHDDAGGGIYLVKMLSGSTIVYTDTAVPIIHTKNLQKASELLASRGVPVGPTQEDRDGSRFFEIQDLDGNKIQILQR